ncbi:hypothetical protein DRJ22_04215 [Candidatus Woesearchaeota archaeon]|nr:MAG: hypothetical protein DRJ22_04215 [Candidatus Woesearchaeota archaeon]
MTEESNKNVLKKLRKSSKVRNIKKNLKKMSKEEISNLIEKIAEDYYQVNSVDELKWYLKPATYKINGIKIKEKPLAFVGPATRDLLKHGLDKRILESRGFDPKTLFNLGVNWLTFRELGYSIKEIRDSFGFFDAWDIKDAGYSVEEAIFAGYSVSDLYYGGFKDATSPENHTKYLLNLLGLVQGPTREIKIYVVDIEKLSEFENSIKKREEAKSLLSKGLSQEEVNKHFSKTYEK